MTKLPYWLRDNGAEDPNCWAPTIDNRREHNGMRRAVAEPAPGDLVAWRYAAWRVHQIRPYLEVDMTDKEQKTLKRLVRSMFQGTDEEKRAKAWPYHIVLRHHRGPIIIKPGEGRAFRKLRGADPTTEISFTTWPTAMRWVRLMEPFKVCSCHGDPWPCREIDQVELANYRMDEFRKLEAAHAAGMCANCREPISTRQSIVTFPEPSRWLPGAPGPTFHAGRAACWAAAEEYERRGRLVDNPDIPRLASCPGIEFIHEARTCPSDKRVECTAGSACTGLHGPPGHRRETPCWHQVQLADNEGAYARPSFDCGYRQPGVRECVGADLSSGGTTMSPIAADLLWVEKIRQEEERNKPKTTSEEDDE